MDDSLCQHAAMQAAMLAADVSELLRLGFSGDELQRQVECLSRRAFARLGSQSAAAAVPTGETAEDATPIG